MIKLDNTWKVLTAVPVTKYVLNKIYWVSLYKGRRWGQTCLLCSRHQTGIFHAFCNLIFSDWDVSAIFLLPRDEIWGVPWSHAGRRILSSRTSSRGVFHSKDHTVPMATCCFPQNSRQEAILIPISPLTYEKWGFTPSKPQISHL